MYQPNIYLAYKIKIFVFIPLVLILEFQIQLLKTSSILLLLFHVSTEMLIFTVYNVMVVKQSWWMWILCYQICNVFDFLHKTIILFVFDIWLSVSLSVHHQLSNVLKTLHTWRHQYCPFLRSTSLLKNKVKEIGLVVVFKFQEELF